MATQVRAEDLINGVVKQRQGGTTGDNTWVTAGTSNTNTATKDVKIQVGTVTTSASADVTVTFPEAFTQPPIVILSPLAVGGVVIPNIQAAPSTTTFQLDCWSTAGARVARDVYWIAIGQ